MFNSAIFGPLKYIHTPIHRAIEAVNQANKDIIKAAQLNMYEFLIR